MSHSGRFWFTLVYLNVMSQLWYMRYSHLNERLVKQRLKWGSYIRIIAEYARMSALISYKYA